MVVLSPFPTRATGQLGNLVKCDLDTDQLAQGLASQIAACLCCCHIIKTSACDVVLPVA